MGLVAGGRGGAEEKKEDEKNKSSKDRTWSAVPVPCLSILSLKLNGLQGSGPEGVDDLCFQTGEFSPSPPPPSPLPLTSRPISQPRGPYPSLKAQIPVLRPKSQYQGLIPTPRPKSQSS